MKDNPLGIIELLSRVGESNVKVQPLARSVRTIKATKHGDSDVTFSTDQVNAGEMAANRSRNVGLIVWIPTEMVAAAIVSHNASGSVTPPASAVPAAEGT